MSCLYKSVYQNINDSDIKSNAYGFTFYFSRELYQQKFDDSVKEFVEVETQKLENKFLCKIEAQSMMAILFYKKIEKQGFRIEINGYELEKEYRFKFNAMLESR